jgi:methionyl aminopeptidase
LNTPSSPSRTYENELEEDEDDDFGGIYRIILPPEPFIFGTSHIPQRSVPAHIPRPDYITVFRADQAAGSTSHSHSHPRPKFKFNGVIELGGDEELGVREAAKLAGRVREYAGSLVKVRRVLFIL